MATTETTAAKVTAKPAKSAAPAGDALASAEKITQAARDQFEQVVSVFNENAETLRAQSEDALETVRENFTAAQERFEAANRELADATREEIADAVDLVNDLGRAKTVADAMEIQRDYWTNLFEARVERSREMTETSVKATREAFEPINKSMSAFGATASFEKLFPFANPFFAK